MYGIAREQQNEKLTKSNTFLTLLKKYLIIFNYT